MVLIPIDTPIVNSGFLYVSNLIMSYVSTKSISISPGAARDASDTNDIILQSQITIDATKVGANGLDGGSLLPSIPYFVFIIGDSTGYHPTAGIISKNSPRPVLPAGYDMYRRIGWAVTDSSADIVKFYQRGAGETRTYYYDDGDLGGTVVLSGGVQTTFTTVALYPIVPPMSTKVYFRTEYHPSNPANSAAFRSFGSTNANGNVTIELGPTQIQLQNIFVDCQTDDVTGACVVQYKVSAGDTVSLVVVGYDDYL